MYSGRDPGRIVGSTFLFSPFNFKFAGIPTSLRISTKTIQEIKSRIDIVDVIGDFVALKKAGSSYKALSPFTDEKTPSFFVSPSKDIFKCFSSGKGGDAISFIMEIEGISYLEALKYLAKKYGITIEMEDSMDEDLQEQSERESIFIVMNFAKEHFIKNLWEHPEGESIGLSYLKERGFTEKEIRKFELGYSLNSWDDLLKAAIPAGYPEEILEKAGLVLKNEDRTYDRFRGRVIFPVHNLSGRVIAFGARILTKDKNQPKYINSPESPIYHKSSIVYGIYQARQPVRKEDNCYLVEGYTDVISMHISGVENVVASSGTSLTGEQIRLIKRYTENITIVFDGDPAGIKASLRGIDMVLESGMNVRAVVIPDNEDPDSYAKKVGSAQFKDFLIHNRKDFITFKAGLFAEESARDPIRRAETIREIVSSIAKVPDPVKKAVYLKETARVIEMEESVLLAELNRLILKEKREKSGKNEPVVELKKPVISPPDTAENLISESLRRQERESIRLLLSYGLNKLEDEHHLYEFMLQELSDVEFQTPVYNRILQVFAENLLNGHVIDAEYIINNGPEEIRKEVIDLISNRYEISENWHRKHIYVPSEPDTLNKSVLDNIIRLKHRVVMKLIEENIQELRVVKTTEEIEQLLKVSKELNRIKTDLAKKLGITVT